MTIIVFSKDQPFRLKELLRSLALRVKAENLRTIVIWQSGREFVSRYKQLPLMFPGVDFIRGSKALCDSLDKALARNDDYYMLVAGNAFFYRDIDLDAAKQAMLAARAFCVQFSLFPGLSKSGHSTGLRVLQPELIACGRSYCMFVRTRGTYDWNQPWDLSATLYSRDSIRKMLDTLDKLGIGYEDAGQLETYGHNLVYSRTFAEFVGNRIICPNTSCVLRVDSVHDSADENVLFDQNYQFDETYCRSLDPDCPRIKSLVVCQPKGEPVA